jgi:hypothetical protein
MAKQITQYTANVTGISANNIISSASEITARQNSSTAINNTGEVLSENRTLLEAIHTTDHIVNVISTSFSAGTNELAILADAITWWDQSVYTTDKTAQALITGWGAKTITGLTSSSTFYIWATFVGGIKDYEATDTNTLPSNLNEKNLIGIATVDGAGAVSFTPQWNGPVTSKTNYFKNAQTFLNGISVINAVNGFLPANYHDVKSEFLTVATIKILAGSRVRSSDNTCDIVVPSDLTINITVSGGNGLDTGAEANSTSYYLYLLLNPTTLEIKAVLSVTNESVTGSITLPSGFTKKRQVLVNGIQDEQLIIFNNSAGNIDYIGGSIIWLTGGNGRGSTNTCIRRLLTIVRNLGTAHTLIQSATLGDSVTINKRGLYFVSFTDGNLTAAERVGISLNSTQLTTAIQTITNETRLVQERTAGATDFKNCCTEHYCKNTDIIRPHGSTTNNLTAEDQVLFKIVRKG